MKLHLEEITRDNWQEVIRLKVTPNQQRFVMNNLYAIAECKFLPERIPLAIYDDATIVGMAICSYDEPAGQGWVHRLVIAEGFENRGYSTNTMQWIIRRFRRLPGCTGLLVHYRPDNSILADFYKTYGFRETPDTTADGETIASLSFAPLRDKDRDPAAAAAATSEAPDTQTTLAATLSALSPSDSSLGLPDSLDLLPTEEWTRPVNT